MNAQPQLSAGVPPGESVSSLFQRVRARTTALCETLQPEDTVVQSMPDVSPTKWHLAHTTWFFERFLLSEYVQGYRPFHERYDFLFNSYYHTVGEMFPRTERGLLSRPTLAEVMAYRAHVDAAMSDLLQRQQENPDVAFRVVLGANHEQQHQELLLMDIKHVFSLNPLRPALRAAVDAVRARTSPLRWIEGASGIREIGHAGEGFAFDNERPRHRELLQPHLLASRPVSNGEFMQFIRDGGYRNCELWLSDGWSKVQSESWDRPLYWAEDLQSHFTLHGQCEIDLDAPVCHLSYFEAEAFARWAGARLPGEAEWECAAASVEGAQGHFQESDVFKPRAAQGEGLGQMFGDVWEWTASPYVSYPGFRPLPGSLGEYNGKFMCGQWVLRGGACITPADHVRASYRNFFYPHQRWQFSGARLARDA